MNNLQLALLAATITAHGREFMGSPENYILEVAKEYMEFLDPPDDPGSGGVVP